MIQEKPYEFMVKYTPQREWIEKRGILMWLSTFFVEVGAATFLIASIFGNLGAMFVGIVMCAILGGGLHLADLGRPLRFWRILFSSGWKTSWIARGIWFVNLFIILGGIYLGLAMLSSNIPGLLIASNVFAFCTIIYFGFLLSYINGLALWNSGLLPILILVISIWGGLNIFMLTSLVTGTESVTLEFWSRIFPLFVIFIVVCFLVGIRYQGEAGRVSFGEIVWRKLAALFWIGFVLFGVAFPMTVGLIDRFIFDVPSIVLSIFLLFELGANLSLRY
jgi:formate-dependent nitrite reductase membrane component NrfD